LPDRCYQFSTSFDGRRLATMGDDYALWDLNTGEKLVTLTEWGGYRAGCDFSPDGRQLFAGGRNGKVRILDLERNSLSEFDTGRDQDVEGVKTINRTNFLLVVWFGRAGRIQVWNFDTRQLLQEFAHTGRMISDANFSQRGDLAFGHDDGTVTIWKADSNWAPSSFQAHRRAVSGMAFTPDGRVLGTGGVEGTAKLWNLASQREIVTLRGHLKSVHALDVSPDGNRLATGSGGAESVKLWDMHTHQELITLASEGPIMVALAFSQDGNKLLGLNDRRQVQVWRGPSWAEIEAAEKSPKP